jgi:hypothetical protein
MANGRDEKMIKWLNTIKGAWRTKISNQPIIYVTNDEIKIIKRMNGYEYDIVVGDRRVISVLRVSNEQQLRGFRSSISIYDKSIANIDDDFMLTRIECMARDGVMEHSEWISEEEERERGDYNGN